jgi:hypothetical protein
MVYTLTVHLYANDHPDSISRIKAKLVEAARIYRKDKETVDWIVMQDVHDPRAFTIVERFENEGVLLPTCVPIPMEANNGYSRVRNTISRILTGRLSILTSSHSLIDPWISAGTKNSILAKMWRFLCDIREAACVELHAILLLCNGSDREQSIVNFLRLCRLIPSLCLNTLWTDPPIST